MKRLERFLKGITRSLAVLALCMWGLVWYRGELVPGEGSGEQESSSGLSEVRQSTSIRVTSADETLMSVEDILAQGNRYTEEELGTFLSQRKQALKAASMSVDDILAQGNRHTEQELDAFLSNKRQKLKQASMSVDDILAQGNRYAEEELDVFLYERKQELEANSISVEDILARANRYTQVELDAFIVDLKRRHQAELDKLHLPWTKETFSSIKDLVYFANNNGQYKFELVYAEHSVVIAYEVFGPDHPETATSLHELAALYWGQGRYREAEPLYVEALAIRRTAMPEGHPDIAMSFSYLGGHYLTQSRFGEAELLYVEALVMRRAALPEGHLDIVISLGTLAQLYHAQGRYRRAGPLYLEILAIERASLPEGHPDIAAALNNLALFYTSQGRYREAEPLYVEALAIERAALPEEHPSIAGSFSNLAVLYKIQGRYEEAEPLHLEALAIMRAALPEEHPSIATSLNNLAALYASQGRYGEAEPLFLEALAMRRAALPEEHPSIATPLYNLAALYASQDRYGEAEPFFLEALAMRRAALPEGHADIVSSFNELALLYKTQGQYQKSAIVYNKAFEGLAGRLRVNAEACKGGGELELVRRNRVSDLLGPNYTRLVGVVTRQDRSVLSSLPIDGTFQIGQELELSATASALAEARASLAGGDEETLRLSKDWCGLRKEITRAQDELDELASQGNPAFEGRIAQLKEEIAGLEVAFEVKDVELRETFPDYAELAIPKSVSEADAKVMLRQGEALLTYTKVQDEDVQGYLALLVTPDLSVPIALSVDFEALAGQVNTLREDVTFPEVQDRALSAGDLPDFDLGLANELYESVFAPLEPYLENVAHVIVVPSGPLESLPFQTLVTELPENMDDDRYANYRSATFLGDQYAFSVLPSVSSLKALRDPVRLKKRAALDPSSPFLGFGDPDLRGQTSGDFALSNASGVTNVGAVRDLTRLDQTGPMLTTLKNVLKGADENLYLKEAATEAQLYEVKDQLPDQEVVVFATHGLVANELPALNLTEPALVMTPPADESDVDPRNDGLLKASEIVGLSFNADLIVLSACNTAAADGTPGAEALSGLAKSFFYTGAQSLLVSHWPTDAITSAALITTMIRLQKEQGLGYAEAHKHGLQIIKAVSAYWPEDEEESEQCSHQRDV